MRPRDAHRRPKRALPATIALLALLGPAAGVAGGVNPEVEQAAALKAEADAAFVEGDYPRALLLLERAYRLDPRPGLIANQGLVLVRLGEYARAAEAFERYLATNPPADKRKAAEAELARIRPEVLVFSEPAGAIVHLDGAPEPLGKTPLKTRLVAGAHFLELRLEGHRTARPELQVRPGKPLTVREKLEPLPQPKATAPAAPTSPPPDRTWAYVGLGTGVALAGIATTFYFLARGEIDERDRARTESAWDAHQATAERHATIAYASAGVGLAAAGVGLYLLLADPDPGPVTPIAHPGGAGLAISF